MMLKTAKPQSEEQVVEVVLRFGQGIDQLSAETSIPEGFARAIVNLDATNTGTLKLRSGTTQALSLVGCHSLWAPEAATRAYFAAGSTLYSFDGTTQTARETGLTPEFPVSYAELLGDVYWSNSVQSGILVGGTTNTTWGPTELTGPLGQTYAAQVRGNIVRYFRSRLYAVDGRTVWATEPMDYKRVDLMRGFMLFESELHLFEPVSGGIYIGTAAEGVRFLSGQDFKQFSVQNADSLAPVRGSGLSVDGATFGSAGQGAIWLTKRGWVFGDGSGSTKRLTDTKVSLPAYESAASLIREANGIRQLMSFAKGGSESAGASDVMTTEVIRNGVLLV